MDWLDEFNKKLANAKRIGIFGGAFDPIHNGHLTVAEYARHNFNLDFILFIPTGTPPHKGKITFNEHRYLMTLLAIADNPNFCVSRLELDRTGESYTIDTLRSLKTKTDAQLFFIIGADATTETWKESENLPQLCQFIRVTRPGYAAANAFEIPGIDISGTMLRDRIKNSQPIKYLLPTAVEKYIYDMQLYKLDKTDNSDKADQIAEIYTAVKSQISEKRFRHTLGVVQTAVLLADFYGENFYNAHVAAIFHDYAKEYSNHEMLNLCQQLQIPLDEIQQQVPNIMHGAVAAKLANRNFAITEKIILHAIENHTIPKPPLSLLDKIIKIADNTEPNRQNFSGQITLHELRKLSKIDLNKATISAIIGDMEYTKRKGQLLHPLSTEVLQYLQKEG